jgi:hypothetical protein
MLAVVVVLLAYRSVEVAKSFESEVAQMTQKTRIYKLVVAEDTVGDLGDHRP